MYLNGKYINDVVDSDIESLLENRVREDQKLDYKRQLHKMDGSLDTRELIKDVTAMYNSDGGCIVYGIDEERDDDSQPNGYPSSFFDNNIKNEDKLLLRIQEIIRNNTDPPVVGVVVRVIAVNGKSIVIIAVPRRWGNPSMSKDTNSFFRRANTQKYPMATTELSRMFLENFQIAESFNSFVEQRTNSVKSRKNPTTSNFITQNAAFLHIVPISHVANELIDVRNVEKHTEDFEAQYGMNNHQGKYAIHYNADGCYSVRWSNGEVISYVQIFRTGYIEYFTRTYIDLPTNKFFNGYAFIMETFWAIRRALRIYQSMNLTSPFLIKFKLTDLGDKFLTKYGNTSTEGQFTTPSISSPVIFIEDIDPENEDLFSSLQPFFDIVWQAAGKREAMTYESCFSEYVRHTYQY